MTTVERRRESDLKLDDIERQLQQVQADVKRLSSDIEDLVSAWKAASWLVSFVKWAGGLAVALTAIYTLFKGIK